MKKKDKGEKILDLIDIHEIKIELLKLLSRRNKKQFMLIKVRVYFMNVPASNKMPIYKCILT